MLRATGLRHDDMYVDCLVCVVWSIWSKGENGANVGKGGLSLGRVSYKTYPAISSNRVFSGAPSIYHYSIFSWPYHPYIYYFASIPTAVRMTHSSIQMLIKPWFSSLAPNPC